MVQKVFNRVEKKFLLNQEQYDNLMKELLVYMEIDSYGLHNIRNIYFDTDDFALIRTSIEKPEYKEKFRIRCYGQPMEESDIFLEIKKKYKGVVNKRRVTLKPDEAWKYLLEDVKPQNDGQIMREIDFMKQRYHMKPVLYLAYDRLALFGREDKDFRVTFDRNIRSRRDNLTLFCDEGNDYLMEEGRYLMEVKITNAMPLWFVELLSKYEIRSTSFSKYGRIYQASMIGGIAC